MLVFVIVVVFFFVFVVLFFHVVVVVDDNVVEFFVLVRAQELVAEAARACGCVGDGDCAGGGGGQGGPCVRLVHRVDCLSAIRLDGRT